MTIKDLKKILKFYDEEAEVKIIVNTDDVHYGYGFYHDNNEITTETEEEYGYNDDRETLYLRADI